MQKVGSNNKLHNKECEINNYKVKVLNYFDLPSIILNTFSHNAIIIIISLYLIMKKFSNNKKDFNYILFYYILDNILTLTIIFISL